MQKSQIPSHDFSIYMKLLVSMALALSCVTAIAAEPAYTCNTDRGCKEESGPEYALGRGAKITLPEGWRFYTYPTAPIPEMAGLREIRAVRNGQVIAITPMPKPEQLVASESQVCDWISEGAKQYVAKSQEKAMTPVSFSQNGVVGCYVTFTSANPGEKPFAVLANRRHASVASFFIVHPKVIFSVSAVSETAPDDDYRAALEALKHIQ